MAASCMLGWISTSAKMALRNERKYWLLTSVKRPSSNSSWLKDLMTRMPLKLSSAREVTRRCAPTRVSRNV